MLETLAVEGYNRFNSATVKNSSSPRLLTNVLAKEVTKAMVILPRSNYIGVGYPAQGENADDRVNQQERLRRLVWLASMLESEGTFTFQYNEQVKNGGLHSHIQPRVLFTNTDKDLNNMVQAIWFMEFGLECHRKDGIKGGLGQKLKSLLMVSSFGIAPFLREIRPFMVGGKSRLVDLLLQFIDYRQSLRNCHQRYGEFEFSILKQVREINSGHWRNTPKFSAISSETVRQRREAVWNASDAKIQSGLHGDMQSAAEMTAPLSERKRSRRKKLYDDYGQ